MESTSHLPPSIDGLSRSVSVQLNDDEYEVSWTVSDGRSGSSIFARFTYQSETKLVEREFKNRVFRTIEEASAVKQVLTDVTKTPIDTKAGDRLVGECTPHPVSETVGDISKICSVLEDEVSSLFDYPEESVSNQDVYRIIGTARRSSMGIISRCTRCVSVAPTVQSLEHIVEPEKLKPSLVTIRDAIQDMKNYSLLLTSARDKLSSLDSSISDKISDAISEIIYEIEPKIFRLTQLSVQIDNWIECETGLGIGSPPTSSLSSSLLKNADSD